jgi:hypothetical protein
LSLARESSPLGVGKPNAPRTQALFEKSILLKDVLDQIQLLPIDPAGEHHQKQL